MNWLLLTLFLTSSLGVLSINSAQATQTTSTQEQLPRNYFSPIMNDLAQRFSQYSLEYVVIIHAGQQKQYLLHNGLITKEYTISTSEFGLGSQAGSNKTPLGVHIVKKKFGTNAKLGTIFRARSNTGRIAKILTEPGKRSKADNVTTRILWLSGLEKGKNKGGKVDSYRRYIYIHGTDEEGRLGTPASHGCIRMKNHDVIDFYNDVPTGTLVVIVP